MRDPSGVFVYGTLRSDGTHAGLLAGYDRLPARVRGVLYDLPAGYPALVPDEQAGWVHGELVQVTEPRLLALLDHYEGVGEGLYRRVPLVVHLGLRTQHAWTWVMDHPERRGGRLLASGRWWPSKRR